MLEEQIRKIGWIILVVVLTVFAFILWLALTPATLEIVASANTSEARADPYTHAVIQSWPLYSWGIIAFIGLFFIVKIWKGRR